MDTQHPAIAAVLRAREAFAAEPGEQRASLKRELEAEARGLLMAARMHGFGLSVMHGTATVIDQRGAA